MRKLPLILSMLFLAGMLAGCGGDKTVAGRTGLATGGAADSANPSSTIVPSATDPVSSDEGSSPAATEDAGATVSPADTGAAETAQPSPAATAQPTPAPTRNLEQESKQALDDLNAALRDLDEALKDADQTLNDIDNLDK